MGGTVVPSSVYLKLYMCLSLKKGSIYHTFKTTLTNDNTKVDDFIKLIGSKTTQKTILIFDNAN